MGASPQFIAAPASDSIVISTANLNYNGSGTIGTVFVAGASGARVDVVSICATGTTAAGVVTLYVDDTGLGTNWRPMRFTVVTAIPTSATVPPFSIEQPFAGGYTLAPGALIGASTTIAQGFAVSVRTGGDL
jgi:hypothetical protein